MNTRLLIGLTTAFLLVGAARLESEPQPGADGQSRAVQMTLKEHQHNYIQWALQHAPRTKEKSQALKIDLAFPAVDVYNPSGFLIYHGEYHDGVAADNAKVIATLAALPGGTEGLKAGGLHPSLQEAFDMVPAFKGLRADEVLRNAKFVVVAMTVENCKPCAVQDEAVAKIRQQSGRNGIRVFEVRLSS